MARAGKTTLLIDADLRHPTQHALFKLSPDSVGFSDAVLAISRATVANKSAQQQPLSLAPAVQRGGKSTSTAISLEPFLYAVDIPHLRVMPSGPLPPNTAELLDSKAAHRLFEALASCNFDIVVFDTPPILGLSDARILASRVDGVLVVVDITRAKKVSLKLVKALLARSGAYVPGCVVNKQRHNRHDNTSIYFDSYFDADEQQVGSNHKTKNEISPDKTVRLPRLPKM
jgi:non-specific protein-tyrosine kinase